MKNVHILVFLLSIFTVLQANKLRVKEDFEETFSKLFETEAVAAEESAETAAPAPAFPKVPVEIYYEALCPYCQAVVNTCSYMLQIICCAYIISLLFSVYGRSTHSST
jgi:hypothetical protein